MLFSSFLHKSICSGHLMLLLTLLNCQVRSYADHYCTVADLGSSSYGYGIDSAGRACNTGANLGTFAFINSGVQAPKQPKFLSLTSSCGSVLLQSIGLAESVKPSSQSQPIGLMYSPMTGNLLYGVDVSQWQGTINWNSLASSANFAIIRSSFGCPNPGESVSRYTDAQLRRNQSEARRVGILRGYYHFAYPQYNNPEPEADQFLNAVGPLQQGEILCLDFEESTTKDPVDWCARFLERVFAKTGTRPLLYIDYSHETSYNWSRVINDNDGLWLAKWDGQPDPGSVATQWPFVAIKQYADNGNVGGLNPVDLDAFSGSASQFLAYGYKSPNDTAPSVSFDETRKYHWYGPSDLNTQIVTWTLNDTGGGIGGLSQNWDSDPGGSSPQFPGSHGGYMTFGYLSDAQRQGKHTAYVRAWSSAGSQSQVYSTGWYGYDALPPTATVTSGQTNGTTYNTAQHVSFHIDDPDSGVAAWGAAWDADPGQQSAASDGALDLPTGTHTLHVHTWDNVGNQQDYTFGPYTLVIQPSVISLTLSPTSVVGGNSLTATATLSSPAPIGGMKVLFTSNDSHTAGFPTFFRQVTVPVGFSVVTCQVLTSSVTAVTPVVIQAVAGSGSAQPATLTVVPATWAATSLSVGADGYSRLLWDSTNSTAAFWLLDRSNRYVSQQAYGPFPGWTAKIVSTGPDLKTRVLWANTNGTAAFWRLDANNGYLDQQQYGPFAGWTATALSTGPDGYTRALWTSTGGQAAVWLLDPSNRYVSQQQFGPFAGWAARGLSTGGDLKTRVLWTNGSAAAFWRLDANNGYIDQQQYGPFPGWSAVALTAGADGYARAVWDNADGTAAFWLLDPQNRLVSQQQYGPFSGWTALALPGGPDATSRALWANVSGQVALWGVDPNNRYTGEQDYGPF